MRSRGQRDRDDERAVDRYPTRVPIGGQRRISLFADVIQLQRVKVNVVFDEWSKHTELALILRGRLRRGPAGWS